MSTLWPVWALAQQGGPGPSAAVQVASLIINTIGTIALAWIGYLTLKLREKAAEAAKETHTVATVLADARDKSFKKMDGIQTVANKTWKMSNSAMAAMLETNARDKDRIAKMTNDPADAEIAKQAWKKHEEHMATQYDIDATQPSDKALGA